METRKMDMPLPAHAELVKVRDALRRQTGRKGFTFGETVEQLCRQWWKSESDRLARREDKDLHQ